MTVGLPLATLIVCVTLGLFWLRIEPLVKRWLDWRLTPPAAPAPLATVPDLPPDLKAHVASYPEEWARKDVRSALLEDFALLGDWDQVRFKHRMQLVNPHREHDAGAPDV